MNDDAPGLAAVAGAAIILEAACIGARNGAVAGDVVLQIRRGGAGIHARRLPSGGIIAFHLDVVAVELDELTQVTAQLQTALARMHKPVNGDHANSPSAKG